MRIDWATMLTVFIAIVLAELFCRGVFSGGSIGGTPASVGATTHNNPAPAVIYANPIDRYLAEKYPNTVR